LFFAQSAKHKYIFDVKGWVMLPGLLTEAELAPIREHQLAFKCQYTQAILQLLVTSRSFLRDCL
jgi:hypothetical protein